VKKRQQKVNLRDKPQRNPNHREETTKGAKVRKILGKKDLQVPHNEAVG